SVIDLPNNITLDFSTSFLHDIRLMTVRKTILGDVVTTRFERNIEGGLNEYITIEVPNPVTDTQRLRLVQIWERDVVFPYQKVHTKCPK
ncbi:MAG: hypothetical protein ACREQ5_13565, partial [Candidatus Dormibacteria bacterium]